MDAADVLSDFERVVQAIEAAFAELDDWGLSGERDTQYVPDVIADSLVHERLDGLGYGILSEESPMVDGDNGLMVVVDPLDGSTNASRGLPWYACSLCAVDEQGPLASMVAVLPTGERFTAVRGQGAWNGDRPLAPRVDVAAYDDSLIGLSGLPPKHLGWGQFRSFGAAAVDLVAIATGQFDGFIDCSVDAHGVWDYLGALLICRELGISIEDAHGRELVVLDPEARRTPVAGASPEIFNSLLAARQSFE